MSILKAVQSGESAIAVIGLGYVGLPVALAFDAKYKVIGFDINETKIQALRRGIDINKEIAKETLDNCKIHFTSSLEELKSAKVFIVTVPTPVDEHQVPDLKPLIMASEAIGSIITKGSIVIYESTVYPGCTREECVPAIERKSGLVRSIDFGFGYSPERINPGDKLHTIDNIVKVVAANDEQNLAIVEALYASIVSAGTHRTKTIEIAEAAKVIENTQRDLNISFMNELSMIFHRLGIDTQEVIKAASTKWNFLPFYPGLVGGHCVGVDPWYLLHRAAKKGYDPQVILSGRRVNDSMPIFIVTQLVQILIANGKNPGTSKVLVLGITFKENVTDVRNSKVAILVQELHKYSIKTDICDPLADAEETQQQHGLPLLVEANGPYDAIILAVAHNEYHSLDESFFLTHMPDKPILFDIKGILPAMRDKITYWTL